VGEARAVQGVEAAGEGGEHVEGRGGGQRELARRVLQLPLPGDRLQAMEDALVAEALAASDDNKSAAARLLNVHRKAIERRAERRDAEG